MYNLLRIRSFSAGFGDTAGYAASFYSGRDKNPASGADSDMERAAEVSLRERSKGYTPLWVIHYVASCGMRGGWGCVAHLGFQFLS